MADFYEVATDRGHIAVNMDTVKMIAPNNDTGSLIYFHGEGNRALESTESPSHILQGLDTYKETKAVEIWKRTAGKNT